LPNQPVQPFQQQPVDPSQPLVQVDPVTGQLILAQDPAIRPRAPVGAYVPQQQVGQQQVPFTGVPQQPSVVGNSSQDLQGGRGLY